MVKHKLVIDAGHGGKDPGAVSKWGREEDWTLKIALYQYKRFKDLGIKVGITRTTDKDLTEDQRVALAKEGDYCFSNHLNAGGGDRAEVIHSIFDDGKLANEIKKYLLEAGQNAVKVYDKEYNDGDYYYMHRRTGATKTNIIEYSFIDNEADFTDFKNNWEKYAEAPVKAFCNFIGHPYKPPYKDSTAQKPISNTASKGTVDEELEKAIAYVKSAGISDGSNPQNTLTRGQLFKILYRMAQKTSGKKE